MNQDQQSAVAPGASVFRVQLAVLAGFCAFAALVIVWISRLIYVSWKLKDVFSASIGIALVAIPIFLFLSFVVIYVFWGLRRGRNMTTTQGP